MSRVTKSEKSAKPRVAKREIISSRGISRIIVLTVLAAAVVVTLLSYGFSARLFQSNHTSLSVIELGLTQPPSGGPAKFIIEVKDTGNTVVSDLSVTTSAGTLSGGLFSPSTIDPGQTSLANGTVTDGCSIDLQYTVVLTADGYTNTFPVSCTGRL